mmetsp:Transcript_26927/g.57744  ORF Transcript_26927/g.57744 Transcript_26927/m.57744 type:complete len:160 (-) Transcript_26927:561-1040(-)
MMANPREGIKCPIACKGYPIRKCPICLCNCNLYATEDDYRDIAAVQALDVEPDETEDDTRDWLDSNLDVNVMQRQQSKSIYSKRVAEGRMSNDSSFVSNVVNEGAYAQAMNIVGNPPSQPVASFLKSKVDKMEHPNGKTYVNMGGEIVDMRTHGKRGDE